jgi:hypothetical protein
MNRLGVHQMFSATYPEFQVVPAKAGFDLSLQVNVDLVTPANAGASSASRVALQR